MPVYDISLWEFLKYATTVKRENSMESFFPLSERIEMTKRICDALRHMNKLDVAHRDLKPRFVIKIFHDFFESIILSNILLKVHKDGHNYMKWKSGSEYPRSIVLTDFGISTSIRVSAKKRNVGTPGWTSPEQWLGDFFIP